MEPKLERLAEAGLSVVTEYLDVYRALSSEAYLGLAHSNALSNAFKLTGRLRKIGDVWEAVNKDFYDLAEQVEQFAASLLNYIVKPYEVNRSQDTYVYRWAVGSADKTTDSQSWGPRVKAADCSGSNALGQGTLSLLRIPLEGT